VVTPSPSTQLTHRALVFAYINPLAGPLRKEEGIRAHFFIPSVCAFSDSSGIAAQWVGLASISSSSIGTFLTSHYYLSSFTAPKRSSHSFKANVYFYYNIVHVVLFSSSSLDGLFLLKSKCTGQDGQISLLKQIFTVFTPSLLCIRTRILQGYQFRKTRKRPRCGRELFAHLISANSLCQRG